MNRILWCIVIMALPFTAISQYSLKEYTRFTQNTMDGTRHGVIHGDRGDTIAPANYDEIHYYDNGNFIVKQNNKFGLVDTTRSLNTCY